MNQKLLKVSLFLPVLITLFLIAPGQTQAAGFYDRFTVVLDGNEPTFDPNACGTLANFEVITVVPSVSGDYYYQDLSRYAGLDIVVEVFVNSFDPNNPTANFLTAMDDDDTVTLAGGTVYKIVVYAYCGVIGSGRADFVLTGPSALGGTDPVTGFSGTFTGAEPTFDSPYCGNSNSFVVVGPFTPPATGLYAYGDISIEYGVDIQIDVYHSAFDPNFPDVNYVAGGDDQESFELTNDRPYFFVISPLCGGSQPGIWDFVIVGRVASVGFVNLGLVQINAGSPVQPSFAPGDQRIGLTLPSDSDGNGFDTYVVASVSSVDGEYWLGLWLGSVELLWVRFDEVIPVTPISGIE